MGYDSADAPDLLEECRPQRRGRWWRRFAGGGARKYDGAGARAFTLESLDEASRERADRRRWDSPAPYASVRTFADEEILTAAEANLDFRDNVFLTSTTSPIEYSSDVEREMERGLAREHRDQFDREILGVGND